MKAIATIIATLALTACSSMSHQTVSYVDSTGVPRDGLGRDATNAGIPLCSEVTLRRSETCRIR